MSACIEFGNKQHIYVSYIGPCLGCWGMVIVEFTLIEKKGHGLCKLILAINWIARHWVGSQSCLLYFYIASAVCLAIMTTVIRSVSWLLLS